MDTCYSTTFLTTPQVYPACWRHLFH